MKLKKLAALVMAGALCMSAFTGCGVKPEEPVATLGEEVVTFDMANFLCKYQKATVDDFYSMYAQIYGVNSLWDLDMSGEGSTLEEDLEASVMDVLHDLYTLKAHMADYKVEITADEEAAIKKAVSAFMADNTAEAIEEFGATEEVVTDVLTLYTIQAKMFDAMTADVDRVVSDEDANMRGFSYITIGLEGEYNSSGSYEEYTDTQIKALKEKAAKIEAALEEGDKLEDVAEEYDYDVSESAYNKKDDSMDTTLMAALNALKEGEVSPMVETKTAIYFLRIDADVDADATEDNRQSIIEERENECFNELMETWQKDDGWTVEEDVVAKIDFHNVFTQTTESSESSEHDDTESTEDSQSTEGTESTETTESN